jgi:Uma2 family endonuclease
MSAEREAHLSPEAYLRQERKRSYKSEYLAGQIYALAGGSRRHNLIVANVIAALHGQLRRRSCTVYPSDLRVHVPGVKYYTYPDVSVACDPLDFADNEQDTLLNPVVLIEVLSQSTENYDRGRKFKFYRAIPSFQEYLLIAQDSMHIEHYVRQPDNQWLFVDVDDAGATIHLASILCELLVTDIYEKVDLTPDEADS